MNFEVFELYVAANNWIFTFFVPYGGFFEQFENDKNFPIRKNILASNSMIHDELKDLILKKDIE